VGCGPNDIEFSGERKRVRCNEGLGGSRKREDDAGPAISLDEIGEGLRRDEDGGPLTYAREMNTAR
jgi:hypothetical protein